MGVNILYGESRSELTKACLEQVHRFRRERPNDRAVLLVPETSKMDMEYEYLSGTQEQGMMLTEVLSFSRFCYRVLGETGSDLADPIDDAGKSMLIYKILKEKEDHFVLFKNLCQKPGFISEILSVMGDLKRVLIDAPQLERASKELTDPILAQKAKELSILFQAYEEELKKTSLKDPQENYTRTTRQISLLAQARTLAGTGPLSWPYSRLEWLFQAGIWIVGFGESRDFTPQEYAMMEALNRCCDLTVTLVYDSSAEEAAFTQEKAGLGGGDSLFRAGLQSRRRFSERGWLAAPPKHVPDPSGPPISGQPPAFSHLASCWRDQNPRLFLRQSLEEKGMPAPVTLIHSVSKRGEVAILAGEIRRLVREEAFRYRDIAVMAADIESYGAIVHAAFKEASIPYYLDEKKSLGRTALARMVRSLLDLCVYHWSQNTLMSYARCGLTDASPHEIDELETFLLSRGIKWENQLFDDARFGPEWKPGPLESPAEESEDDFDRKSDRTWNPLDSGNRTMIELRDRICRNALVFEKNCKAGTTSSHYCKALRVFLQAEEIPRKIERQSTRLLDETLEDAATALVKAWNELLRLLEQMEQIGQDTPMALELFRGILLNGMEKAVSGTIPSAVDQVRFAPVKQISNKQWPVVFIIGLTDSAYPEKLSSEGILKDREREAFSTYFETDIPSVVSDKYYEDLYRTYSLFSLPTRRLYLSCPEPDDTKHLLESKIMSFARECAPACRNIHELDSPGPFDVQIYSKRAAFHQLVAMRRDRPADRNRRKWDALYRVMSHQPEFQSRFLALQNLQKRSQEQIHLSGEHIARRYSDPIAMSVSQLETYSACAYAHFAKYLLKLQPRISWDPRSSDTGTLLHGIVEIAVGQFLEDFSAAQDPDEKESVLQRYRSMDFETYSLEKMNEIIRRDNMAAFLDQGFFASKGRTSYRLAASTLQAIFDQFDPQGFVPGILEWTFSDKNNNALSLPLPDGSPLHFQGKVDRIDLAGSYFRVIDYKSGNQTVELDRWYHGLSLQLPAYIAAFCRQYPDKIPKEAAYMRFARPIIPYENGSARDIDQNHARNIKKQYQFRGANMNPEELLEASRHTIDQMKRLSTDLLHGNYAVNPKKIVGKDPPCNYCDYLSICGFESKYDDFNYLGPIEKMQDNQGKRMTKTAAFCKKCREEHKG